MVRLSWWSLPTHSINNLRSTQILNKSSSHYKPECLAVSLPDYNFPQKNTSEASLSVHGSFIDDIATVMHGVGTHTANCSHGKFYQAYLSREEQASSIDIFN
jgi:hypothetical protein